jgi:hypothetical protein
MSLFDRFLRWLEYHQGIDPMILLLAGMAILTLFSLFGWRPW